MYVENLIYESIIKITIYTFCFFATILIQALLSFFVVKKLLCKRGELSYFKLLWLEVLGAIVASHWTPLITIIIGAYYMKTHSGFFLFPHVMMTFYRESAIAIPFVSLLLFLMCFFVVYDDVFSADKRKRFFASVLTAVMMSPYFLFVSFNPVQGLLPL